MLLALREVARAKLRFGLLITAVAALVLLILFQQALLGSLVTSFIGALREQSAQVLVFGADARRNVAGSVVLPPQAEAVAAVQGVGAAVPVGYGTFTVSTPTGEDTDASVFGFVPGGPGEPTRVVAGRLPVAPGEAVVSREDEEMGFAIGQTVVTAAGGVPMTVVGQTEQSRYSVAPTLWVTYDYFTEVRLGANPDAAGVAPTILAVTPAEGVSAEALASRITAEVDGVEALTREQAVQDSPGVSQVNQSFMLILWLVRAVVLLVIGFFFVILTVQKLPALTLVRAIGAPTAYLVRSLAAQIALVLGAGIVLGVLATMAAISAIPAGLPVSLTATDIAVNVALVAALGVLGSLAAMTRVARIQPENAVQRPSLGGLE